MERPESSMCSQNGNTSVLLDFSKGETEWQSRKYGWWGNRDHVMKDVLAHGKEFGFYFKCSSFNHFVENSVRLGKGGLRLKQGKPVRMMFLSSTNKIVASSRVLVGREKKRVSSSVYGLKRRGGLVSIF